MQYTAEPQFIFPEMISLKPIEELLNSGGIGLQFIYS
jgi:hypothetical protein